MNGSVYINSGNALLAFSVDGKIGRNEISMTRSQAHCSSWRWRLAFIGAAQAAAARAAEAAEPPALENSVVKIFSTMRYPDPFKPWTKQAPSEVTASGVVIEGKRILTNAHVVLYASQVQVQANAAGDKVSADGAGHRAGHRSGRAAAR